MYLKVIDDFYSKENFCNMMTAANLFNYKKVWHPSNVKYFNKTHGYPTYETDVFDFDFPLLNLFKAELLLKTGLKPKKIKTFFRKIYNSDLDKIIKYGMSPHIDTGCELAGVVYYNSFGLDDGTGLYTSTEENFKQIEPDIIIGAKPNRMVIYNSNIMHKPLQDEQNSLRLIQPFFLELDKDENN